MSRLLLAIVFGLLTYLVSGPNVLFQADIQADRFPTAIAITATNGTFTRTDTLDLASDCIQLRGLAYEWRCWGSIPHSGYSGPFTWWVAVDGVQSPIQYGTLP